MPENEREWASAPYVRVYQSIRTDEKFKSVYDDDRALAAWLRLLMESDPVWPAKASVPAGLTRHARDVLTRADILRIDGRTYTLSGLSKERESRKARFGSGNGRLRYPSDVGVKPESEIPPSPVGARTDASVSVSSSGSSSSSEGGAGGNPLTEAITYIEQRSRRPWSFGAGSKPWETLVADVRDFGWPAVQAAMEQLTSPFPDVGQLVFGASNRLHPFEKAPAPNGEADQEYVKTQLEARRKARTTHA